MALFTLGINHRTAPLSVREQVAFHAEELRRALGDLAGHGRVYEAAILSTCNRTEIYCQAESPEYALRWLTEYRHLPDGEVAPYLYAHPGREAVRHAFRVASGLDSMVLGEPQILGQMKEAARIAREAGSLGTTLNKLFQQSFSVAKDVRSGTAIGANVVSMAAASVHLAERIFGNIAEQSVLFIGAGEMIGLCATHFAAQAPRHLEDVTAAAALGVDLHMHPQARTLIEQRMREHSERKNEAFEPTRADNLQRLQMACLPQGAQIIPNPFNRIPGFSVGHVHCFPGFPIMTWPMMEWVLDSYYTPWQHLRDWCELALIVSGRQEAVLTALMQHIEQQWPDVKVFSLPSINHPVYGSHIELGVKGAKQSVQAAFTALQQG